MNMPENIPDNKEEKKAVERNLDDEEFCMNNIRKILTVYFSELRALREVLKSQQDTVGELRQKLAEAQKENEEEQGRWQDAIYALLCSRVPDDKIDGKGCDSGDPLDFTLSEIAQALSHLQNESDDLRAQIATNKAARKKAEW